MVIKLVMKIFPLQCLVSSLLCLQRPAVGPSIKPVQSLHSFKNYSLKCVSIFHLYLVLPYGLFLVVP
jgi:hypothetical protein